MKTNRLTFAALTVAFAVIAGCSGSRTATDEPDTSPTVLALIDGRPITVTEFEDQYLRTVVDTVDAADDSLGAYSDFLDRYVDFRLKVLEAERLGYGEMPDLVSELETYRGQLARPYLMEREVTEPLVAQLYERRGEMIDVSHILIRVAENAPPEDTLAAYRKLNAIADSIAMGADFGDMAIRHSEDPSARAAQGNVGYRGRLGYFTAGRMVAPFEDRMYATPVDSVSDLFRTQFGYHVLKVHGRRPTVPDRRISHIMIQPRSPSPADSADALSRLQAAQDALAAGRPFAEVAQEFSNDTQSAQRGGDLDFIAYDGWLPIEMRDVAFSTDSIGVVLGPVRTRFGWHLMQVTDVRRRPSLDESYADLQTEISRMPRSRQAEKRYARSLRRQHDARVDTVVIGELLDTFGADSLLQTLRSRTLPDSLGAMHFATVGDSTYAVSDFGDHIAGGNVRMTTTTPEDRFREAIDSYLDDRALTYEIAALADRDPRFARTMREFREGLMLFRLMEDSVWSAAAADTASLETYFETHRQDFRFGDRHRILSLISPSDSLLRDAASRMDSGASFADIVDLYADDSLSSMRFDTTLVEGRTESVYDRAIDLEPGANTGVVGFGNGRTVLVNDGIEPARLKTFDEARAELVNQVQTILERRLVQRLRDEHRVEVFHDRLDQVFVDRRSGSDSMPTS